MGRAYNASKAQGCRRQKMTGGLLLTAIQVDCCQSVLAKYFGMAVLDSHSELQIDLLQSLLSSWIVLEQLDCRLYTGLPIAQVQLTPQ